MAIFLTGLAAFFVLFGLDVKHGGIGLGSMLLLFYIFGMRLVFQQESMKRRQRELELVAEGQSGEETKQPSKRDGLRRASIGFAAAASALLAAAPFLAGSAKAIAEQSGITDTYIGTSLVGITTSLPELVTAFAAVRLGAFDLAVGNLFGSNAFNMATLFFVDVAYRSGPLFNSVSDAHAMTALWSILLMSTALMGIIYRVEKRYMLIEPDSFVIILGYVSASGCSFNKSSRPPIFVTMRRPPLLSLRQEQGDGRRPTHGHNADRHHRFEREGSKKADICSGIGARPSIGAAPLPVESHRRGARIRRRNAPVWP